MNKKTIKCAAVLLITLFFLIAASLYFGAQKFSFERFLNAFSKNSMDSIIVFKLRLPRSLLCILCGVLLGGSGAVLQGFFRNPLADSGILGISSGATLGVVLSGFFPLISFKFLAPVSLFAFAGGLAAGFLIFSISFLFNTHSSTSLLLAGTALGTFTSSIVSIILLLKQKELHSVFVWTMGSFNSKGWKEIYFLIIPSLISIFLLLICAPYLDVMGSGEKTAVSLGLNYKYTKLLVLFATSLATSCAVCAGGIISFIGLIAPHIVRNFCGSRHKSLIPLSMLTGSCILLGSDILCRTIAPPSEIPIGIITSIIGAPFFIIVLRNKEK